MPHATCCTPHTLISFTAWPLSGATKLKHLQIALRQQPQNELKPKQTWGRHSEATLSWIFHDWDLSISRTIFQICINMQLKSVEDFNSAAQSYVAAAKSASIVQSSVCGITFTKFAPRSADSNDTRSHTHKFFRSALNVLSEIHCKALPGMPHGQSSFNILHYPKLADAQKRRKQRRNKIIERASTLCT